MAARMEKTRLGRPPGPADMTKDELLEALSG